MITDWHDYLTPQGGTGSYRDCRLSCAPAFVAQRGSIDRLFAALRPRVVACLGAGVLNDIPYASFVESAATIHLVDWMPGAPEFGIAHSIIERDTGVPPRCVYCRLSDEAARSYCRSFVRAGALPGEVCDAFAAGSGDPPTCQAFRKGAMPTVHRADATGGYATAFAEGLAAELRDVTSWRQALRRATALANRVKTRRTRLDIADGSVDLVVSSMIMSQFGHEPYGYFAKQTAAKIGPPTAAEEKRLKSAADTLRTTLLRGQVVGHRDEIERLLAPNGRCFVAFEMFHSDTDAARSRLVEEMHDALGLLAERFQFDFANVPNPLADPSFTTGTGASAVYHFLLAAQTDA